MRASDWGAGLFGAALVGLLSAINPTQAVRLAAAVFTSLIALVAAVLAVVRLIWPPEVGSLAMHLAAGAWLGTAAAIGLAVCALASERNERLTAYDLSPIPITPAPPVGT